MVEGERMETEGRLRKLHHDRMLNVGKRHLLFVFFSTNHADLSLLPPYAFMFISKTLSSFLTYI